MRKQEFKVGDKIQFRYTPMGKLKFGKILQILRYPRKLRDSYARIEILGEKRKYPIKNYLIPYKELVSADFNPSERCSR